MFTFLTSALSTTTISCSNINNSGNVENDDIHDQDKIDSDSFFPKLYVDDYYDFVEFDKEASPIITDKFIFKVLEDVVNRVSSSEGEIKFFVEKISKSAIDFHFKWEYNEIELYKTYSFNIK